MPDPRQRGKMGCADHSSLQWGSSTECGAAAVLHLPVTWQAEGVSEVRLWMLQTLLQGRRKAFSSFWFSTSDPGLFVYFVFKA